MAYDQKEHNQAAWLTEPTQNPLEILGKYLGPDDFLSINHFSKALNFPRM